MNPFRNIKALLLPPVLDEEDRAREEARTRYRNRLREIDSAIEAQELLLRAGKLSQLALIDADVRLKMFNLAAALVDQRPAQDLNEAARLAARHPRLNAFYREGPRAPATLSDITPALTREWLADTHRSHRDLVGLLAEVSRTKLPTALDEYRRRLKRFAAVLGGLALAGALSVLLHSWLFLPASSILQTSFTLAGGGETTVRTRIALRTDWTAYVIAVDPPLATNKIKLSPFRGRNIKFQIDTLRFLDGEGRELRQLDFRSRTDGSPGSQAVVKWMHEIRIHGMTYGQAPILRSSGKDPFIVLEPGELAGLARIELRMRARPAWQDFDRSPPERGGE